MGVAKKMIVADSMSLLAQPIVTSGAAPYGRLDYWVGITSVYGQDLLRLLRLQRHRDRHGGLAWA
jgi:hypothetical protein